MHYVLYRWWASVHLQSRGQIKTQCPLFSARRIQTVRVGARNALFGICICDDLTFQLGLVLQDGEGCHGFLSPLLRFRQ